MSERQRGLDAHLQLRGRPIRAPRHVRARLDQLATTARQATPSTRTTGGTFKCTFPDGPATTTSVTRRSRRRGRRTPDPTRSRCTVNNVAPTVTPDRRATGRRGLDAHLHLHGHRSGQRHFTVDAGYPNCGAERHARRLADTRPPRAAASSATSRTGRRRPTSAIKVTDDDGGSDIDSERRRHRHDRQRRPGRDRGCEPVLGRGRLAQLHARLVHRSGRGQPVGRRRSTGATARRRRPSRSPSAGTLGSSEPHTYADGPERLTTVSVTVTDDGRRLRLRHVRRARQQRRAVDRDQRRGERRTRARSTA